MPILLRRTVSRWSFRKHLIEHFATELAKSPWALDVG